MDEWNAAKEEGSLTKEDKKLEQYFTKLATARAVRLCGTCLLKEVNFLLSKFMN